MLTFLDFNSCTTLFTSTSSICSLAKSFQVNLSVVPMVILFSNKFTGRYSLGKLVSDSSFDCNIVFIIRGSICSICVLSHGICNRASASTFNFPLL